MTFADAPEPSPLAADLPEAAGLAGNPVPPNTTPTRRPSLGPRWVVILALIGYFGLSLAFGTQSPCGNDLGGVFLPSARYVVGGMPFDIYYVRVGIYPNANGPLGELVLGAVLGIGRAMHLQSIGPSCASIPDIYPAPGDSIALRMWFSLVFAIFPLLVGVEVMRLVDRFHPPAQWAKNAGWQGWRRGLLWAILVLSPAVWDSLIYYGHIEQGMALWFALLAVRWFVERRMIWSGVGLALALLCRTADVFVVVPLVLLLLRDLRWRELLTLGSALAVALAIGIAPFWIADRPDVLYSLVTFRSQLGIGDGSFWTLFRGTPYERLAQPLDSTVALAGAALSVMIMLWWGRVKAESAFFYAVIGCSVLWFSISIKAIWGYYFYDPQTWFVIWAMTLAGPVIRWWAVLGVPLLFTIIVGLTEWRIQVTPATFATAGVGRVEMVVLSLATSLLLFGVLCASILLAIRRRNTDEFAENGLPSSHTIYESSGDMLSI